MKRPLSERSARGSAGFTLIEIMVVVMIIGLMTTIVSISVVEYWKKAQRKKAMADITMFSAAIDTYFLDHNTYPTMDQGLQALPNPPSSDKKAAAKKYINSVPNDPWGHPYVYTVPGVDGNPYTIQSYGEDGVEGGEGWNADIDSWKLNEE